MEITLAHGSGGAATGELIRTVFAKAFDNPILRQMDDSAVVPGSGQLAVTTDSFVVQPLFFPGGDIGRLAVCGTVNDLLMRGATPKYLTAGFILETGCTTQDLSRIARSMAATADEAGVTKDEQRIVLDHDFYLWDTPGMLWPRISIEQSGFNLAASGSIGRNAYDEELVALELLLILQKHYAQNLNERYKLGMTLEQIRDMPDYELLEAIGRKRGCLVKGGVVDLEKAQNSVRTEAYNYFVRSNTSIYWIELQSIYLRVNTTVLPLPIISVLFFVLQLKEVSQPTLLKSKLIFAPPTKLIFPLRPLSSASPNITFT